MPKGEEDGVKDMEKETILFHGKTGKVTWIVRESEFCAVATVQTQLLAGAAFSTATSTVCIQ